jgi:hypothetical protein
MSTITYSNIKMQKITPWGLVQLLIIGAKSCRTFGQPRLKRILRKKREHAIF